VVYLAKLEVIPLEGVGAEIVDGILCSRRGEDEVELELSGNVRSIISKLFISVFIIVIVY
jgi:hypothetical protein